VLVVEDWLVGMIYANLTKKDGPMNGLWVGYR
jgi:hypothetical protein